MSNNFFLQFSVRRMSVRVPRLIPVNSESSSAVNQRSCRIINFFMLKEEVSQHVFQCANHPALNLDHPEAFRTIQAHLNI